MVIFLILDRILDNESDTLQQKLVKIQKIKDTMVYDNEDDYNFRVLVINEIMNELECQKKGLK